MPTAHPPAGAPIVVGDVVVVPLRATPPEPPGISAHSLRDGAVRWSVRLAAEKPLAADGERVFVVEGEAIHAVSAADGKVAWRTVVGRPITAAPLAHAGWVIVAAAGDLIAIRAADGVVLWRKPLGPIEFRPALDGDLLVVSLLDGRLVALKLTDGSDRWTANLRSSPREPYAIGGRVYVGTQDKIFYAIMAESGRIIDHMPIGAPLLGRVAVDDEHVYMAGLDNMLRVVRRSTGVRLWQKSLAYRPASGPVLIGKTVVVPGYVETPLPAFAVDTGAAAGTLGFDGSLVALPVFATLPDRRFAAIGITGGLDNKWMLSLRTPSLVRPIQAQPLTVLPGEVVQIPSSKSQAPTTPKSQAPNPNPKSQIPSSNYPNTQVSADSPLGFESWDLRLGFGGWEWLGFGAWILGFDVSSSLAPRSRRIPAAARLPESDPASAPRTTGARNSFQCR